MLAVNVPQQIFKLHNCNSAVAFIYTCHVSLFGMRVLAQQPRIVWCNQVVLWCRHHSGFSNHCAWSAETLGAFS